MSVRSIARKLKVSPTAVSLALKNSPRVSEKLRSQVQKLAKAEGYVPNARLAELMSEVRHSQKVDYRATLVAFSLFPEEEPWRVGYPHLKLYLDGARARAVEHGYRLEYLWLKQPDMTIERFGKILDARGIQGLLCLGSRNPEERFPAEFYRFAVVTFAASIPSKLHRVASHFTVDARMLFEQLAQRGYVRPGLIILQSGDRRTNFAYSEAYLGIQERSPAHSACSDFARRGVERGRISLLVYSAPSRCARAARAHPVSFQLGGVFAPSPTDDPAQCWAGVTRFEPRPCPLQWHLPGLSADGCHSRGNADRAGDPARFRSAGASQGFAGGWLLERRRVSTSTAAKEAGRDCGIAKAQAILGGGRRMS